MKQPVAVLGAGGPAGANFIRSLRADPELDEALEVVALDHNPAHLALVRGADAHFVMRGLDQDLLEGLRPKLVHAQPDPMVRALASTGLPTYMPSTAFLDCCQDKLATAHIWARAGLGREPEVVRFRADLWAAERHVGYPCWIRARHGAGARFSSPAKDRDTAGMWVNYLTARFGAEDLVVSPYLPGRDYGVTTLWWRGALMAILCRERLEYLYPQHSVSGRTGTPVVARLVKCPTVEQVAIDAVLAVARAVGEAAHGVLCVDLRCDADGAPVPTEINAGRFFTTSHVGLRTGPNIPALYARIALGFTDPDAAAGVAVLPEAADGTLVIRHIDAHTVWITPDEQDEALRAAVEEMVA